MSTHPLVAVCANRDSIVCRRSARQSIALLIRLRSKLTRRPVPEVLLLGFRAREGFYANSIYLELKAHFLKMSLTSNPHDIR
jgi:hypothetical protein